MSHIRKHSKCHSNLQRHSFLPFLSAFTQYIVSQLRSSSLGDLHLIRSSRNDISQPAAWHCGSAKHQIQVLDFFTWCHFFEKAELLLFSHWAKFRWPFWPQFLAPCRTKVRDQSWSGGYRWNQSSPQKDTWLERNIVRLQNKQLGLQDQYGGGVRCCTHLLPQNKQLKNSSKEFPSWHSRNKSN